MESIARDSSAAVPAGNLRRLADGAATASQNDGASTASPVRVVLADDPDTQPQIEVGAQDCEQWRVGTRTYGLDAEGETLVVTAGYSVDGDAATRLLNSLPAAVVVPCDDEHCPTLDVLAAEVAKDQAGQDIVLERLLELLLVYALREWFDRPEANTPAWYRALGDDVVGPALRAIHDGPERAWTVADLAARAGVSRAAMARRFTALVGVPPLTYLHRWRVLLAQRALRGVHRGAEGAVERVGALRQQAVDQLLPFRLGDINSNGSFIPVCRKIISAFGGVLVVAVLKEGRAPVACVITASRSLDFNDICPEIAQYLRTKRPGQYPGKIRHLQSIQREGLGRGGDQQRRCGVLQHPGEALARIGRVERHPGSAGQKDAEHGHDPLDPLGVRAGVVAVRGGMAPSASPRGSRPGA